MKDQITAFNYLVEQQMQLINKLSSASMFSNLSSLSGVGAMTPNIFTMPTINGVSTMGNMGMYGVGVYPSITVPSLAAPPPPPASAPKDK